MQALRRIRQDVVLDHWHWPLTTSPDELQRRVDALLAGISAPYVHVAAGELPAQVRDHLLSHVRSARIATLPGGGHVAHLDHSAEFAELLAGVVVQGGPPPGG